MLDPVVCHVERHHHHGEPILLSHQTGLTVDGTLQDRQVGCPAGDIDDQTRDVLAAFNRAELGADEAAAIGDRGGVGVEEADEGLEVFGFLCLLEVPDDIGALGCRSRGSLLGANATAGRCGQLATCRRGTADDLRYFGEGVVEDIVQDERDPLGRGHRFQHHEDGHVDRLIEGDSVGRVNPWCRPTAR